MVLLEEERVKRTEEIFEKIRTENFLKLMSDNKRQIRKLREHQDGRMTKKLHLSILLSSYRKSKIKILKETRGK